tara:strand:- start:355 stop:615 length:261 start_codon:yes stop_codon:yes gene_type:complete
MGFKSWFKKLKCNFFMCCKISFNDNDKEIERETPETPEKTIREHINVHIGKQLETQIKEYIHKEMSREKTINFKDIPLSTYKKSLL